MIVLLAILVWTFLLTLALSLCRSAQRGDLLDSPPHIRIVSPQAQRTLNDADRSV
jgi:hypothetical protein